MVSVVESVPTFVREGDVDTFLELHDPRPSVRQRLLDAAPDDRVRLLARAWFNRFHGDRREAKRLFVLFMKEEGLPFAGEDIEAVTGEPPVNTQS